VSVGDMVEECLTNIREALQAHFAGIREDGDSIPDPVSLVDCVDIPLAEPAHPPAKSSKTRTSQRLARAS